MHQPTQLVELALTTDEAIRFFGQVRLNRDYLVSAERRRTRSD